MIVLLVFLFARPAAASPLLTPAVGVPDSASGGTEVARPPSPEGALFQNPAGLAAFETTTYSAGIGFGFGQAHVDVSMPPGYEDKHNLLGLVPSGAVSLPLGARTHLGIGFFGSTGYTFDFEAETPLAPYGFFSEISIGTGALALAYRLREDLWVGIEVSPLFGYLRNRVPLPDPTTGSLAQTKYTLRGPGIQGMAGVTWLPHRIVSLGLGVRTPGAIWLDGSTVYAGDRRDVDLVIQMPTQVFAGATLHAADRVDVSVSVRWSDTSRFGHSDIEFAGVALPLVPDAKDEWRTGIAAIFRATDDLTLRGGVGYATAIVGDAGASPLLFDADDVKIFAGASYSMGPWTAHVSGGYQFEGETEVSADEALILPGRYTNRGGIVLFGAEYRL